MKIIRECDKDKVQNAVDSFFSTISMGKECNLKMLAELVTDLAEVYFNSQQEQVTNKTDIGKRMNEIGMSRSDFARKADVKVSTANAWIRGEHPVSTSKIIPICDILGITIEQMFGEEETKSNNHGLSADNIAENIKNYRKKKHLSQKQLAELAGIGDATIYYWEKGKLPTASLLPTICRTLNVTSRQLFERSNE